VGNPHLSITGTLSHLANVRLLFGWCLSAGTFSIESSRANQWPRVFVGLVASPTAAVMRVDDEDLVLSALNLASLVFGVRNHLSIFNQAEETRMALMGNPELAIAATVAKGVVCIAASDWTGRTRVASRVVGRVVGRVSRASRVSRVSRASRVSRVSRVSRASRVSLSMQGCNTCKDEGGNKKASL